MDVRRVIGVFKGRVVRGILLSSSDELFELYVCVISLDVMSLVGGGVVGDVSCGRLVEYVN